MKRTTGVMAGLMIMSFLAAGSAQAAEKMAFVDLSKIFADYGKTKDYDKVLTDKENAYTADRDKKVAEVKAFQDKLNLLSAKEKEAKKAELETKVKTLRDYDTQKRAELTKDQEAKMKEILKDIESTVQTIAQKEGYIMVFNDRVLVYQDKSLDITEQVLDALNKGYKK